MYTRNLLRENRSGWGPYARRHSRLRVSPLKILYPKLWRGDDPHLLFGGRKAQQTAAAATKLAPVAEISIGLLIKHNDGLDL